MTSFGRGTGPELQYWHARLCSILRAESSDLTALSDEDFAPIEEEKYTELLRMLGQYPDITNSAYKTLEPPTVMLYLVSVTDHVYLPRDGGRAGGIEPHFVRLPWLPRDKHRSAQSYPERDNLLGKCPILEFEGQPCFRFRHAEM
jgi:hypothetical protein